MNCNTMHLYGKEISSKYTSKQKIKIHSCRAIYSIFYPIVFQVQFAFDDIIFLLFFKNF